MLDDFTFLLHLEIVWLSIQLQVCLQSYPILSDIYFLSMASFLRDTWLRKINMEKMDWDSLHARLNATTSYGVTTIRSTKLLKHTGILFRKNLKIKGTASSNAKKYMRLCLQLDKMSRIYVEEFLELNWLNVHDRYLQFIVSYIFKLTTDSDLIMLMTFSALLTIM